MQGALATHGAREEEGKGALASSTTECIVVHGDQQEVEKIWYLRKKIKKIPKLIRKTCLTY